MKEQRPAPARSASSPQPRHAADPQPPSPLFSRPQVWNAQSAGARGAIVVNFEDKLTTMEAPDDDDEASVKFLT